MISSRWTRLGISSKLVLISVVGVLVSVLTTSVVVLMNERSVLRSALVRELATELDVLSYSLEASLAFKDAKSGESLLQALALVPDLEKVVVFDEHYRRFISFESPEFTARRPQGRSSFLAESTLRWPTGVAQSLREDFPSSTPMMCFISNRM